MLNVLGLRVKLEFGGSGEIFQRHNIDRNVKVVVENQLRVASNDDT